MSWFLGTILSLVGVSPTASAGDPPVEPEPVPDNVFTAENGDPFLTEDGQYFYTEA